MKIIPTIKYLMVLFLFSAMSCEEIILNNKTFKVGQESTFRINQLYISTDGQYTLQINEITTLTTTVKVLEGLSICDDKTMLEKSKGISTNKAASFEPAGIKGIEQDIKRMQVDTTLGTAIEK